MKVVRNVTVCFLLVLFSIAISGCGEEGSSREADHTRPMSEVQAEAEKMSTGDLRTMAMKYKEAIVAQRGRIETITARLKEIPLAEQMSEDAMNMKSDIKTIQRIISALKERFDVYYEKLKAAGGDLSGLEI